MGRNRQVRAAHWLLPGLLALATTSVLAGPPPAVTPDTLVSADTTDSFGTPLSDASLATYRGGHELALTFNIQDLNANLTDNVAAYNLTGSNTISGNAFAGTSGIPTVIQNSGNNVIVQNATILNVTVR